VVEYQKSFDFDDNQFSSEKNFFPPYIAKSFILPKDNKSIERKILGYMRELTLRANSDEMSVKDSYRTKKHFREILRPDFYNPKSLEQFPSFPIFDGYNTYDSRDLTITKHKKSVDNAIHRINLKLRESLKDLKSESQKLDFLRRSVEVLIVVGTTEQNAAIYAYHSADLPQSLENLNYYIEWGIEHQEIQGTPLKMAELLHKSRTQNNKQQLSLDIDFSDYDMNDKDNQKNWFFWLCGRRCIIRYTI
jgi:hypothetical protein